MEGQSERTGGGRRRRRRKKNKAQKPANTVPVLIAARRPDSPLLATGTRRVVASAAPRPSNGSHANLSLPINGAEHADSKPLAEPARRRVARIVHASKNGGEGNQRELLLIERLVRSQGRGAISRAADDLWECQLVPPKEQRVQIQLLEHENERRAQDAVFVIAELLQKERPIQRPVLDQRLRRLEQFAEDPITRDAAGALRRSMRSQYGA